MASLQSRFRDNLLTITANDPTDVPERRARFGEEAMELVQACGGTAAEMHQLVDYVFSRPQGTIGAEIGGALSTLADLANMTGHDMMLCGEVELARRETPELIAKIRGKRSRRHGRGPLPGVEADLVPA